MVLPVRPLDKERKTGCAGTSTGRPGADATLPHLLEGFGLVLHLLKQLGHVGFAP